MTDDFQFPTPADVLAIHEDIIADHPESEPGVRTADAVASALEYVSDGYFDRTPETIHEAAVELVRLLVTDQPFVDGNRRTALNTAAVLYKLNGYAFEYGDASIRALLERYATDEEAVTTANAVAQFEAAAHPIGTGPGSDSRPSGGTGSSVPTDDEAVSSTQLRTQARTAASPAERRAAVCRLAARDRERNSTTYQRLAQA